MDSVYLTGADALARKLEALSGKDAKAAFRKGTRAAAKIVADAYKQVVPERTGATRRGIKVRALKRSRKGFGHTAQVPYPFQFSELGTKRIKAQQKLRKAVRSIRLTALGTVQQIAAAEIDQIARRGRA
jgi:HK97 gp10 family phage protein